MASSDSIQLALSVIERINNVKRSMRGGAESHRTALSEVDTTMVNPEKKAILLDGLAGLSVDPVALKSEKDSLQSINQGILDSVPALTK